MQKSISQLPNEAYLYFPTEKQRKNKPGLAGRRFIYFGSPDFDKEQNAQLNEFQEYLKKKSLKKSQSWTEGLVLLFLQGCNYKPADCFTALTQYTTWQQTFFPIQINDKTTQLLNKGVIYLCGRCHRFRPIYVLNITAQVFTSENVQNIKIAVCVFFEYLIKNFMLKGQIQNWICIVNINNLGITQIPVSASKQVVSFMQKNYRGRLYKMYVVNAPMAVSFAYNAAKGLLQEATRQKISLTSGNSLQNFDTIGNLNQIQEKFKGKLKNLVEYWPPRIHCEDSLSKNVKLLSSDEYKKMHAEGKLINYQLNQAILK